MGARSQTVKRQFRHRSAITGRWVTATYAKRYPHLTVRERT